jgi:hypothetical protein
VDLKDDLIAMFKVDISQLEATEAAMDFVVATERHAIASLLAAISICNLSLKNGYEAFAMARCLSHSNKRSRPDHVRLL